MKCIFCLTDTHREPVEHIVPEGLVGHQHFEVKRGSVIAEPRRYLLLDHGEVCRRCNNKLSTIDKYLQDQLGFLRTYWNPVGTKSGKRPVGRRPGMYAEGRSDGPHIALNMEKRPILTPEGVRIPPARTQEMAVRVKDFKVEGRVAALTIQQPVRMNKRFMRALHKIAFELLCFEKGIETVLDSKYDSLRQYILLGRGNREMVFTRSAEVGGWEHPHFGLRYEPSWPGWLGIIRLALTFYIDLSPDNVFFAKAAPAELGANEMIKWTDRDGGTPTTE